MTVGLNDIVRRWFDLLQVEGAANLVEAVQMSLEQKKRLQDLTARYVQAVNTQQTSVDRRVAEFLARVRASGSLKDDDTQPHQEMQSAICEALITGLPNLIRRQVPRSKRNESHQLRIDWDQGLAEWTGVAVAFRIRDAIGAAAEQIAGADGVFSEAICGQLMNDWKENLIQLPRLTRMETDSHVSTYRWELPVMFDEPTTGTASEVVSSQRSPILAMFQDLQAQARIRIEARKREVSEVLEEAQYEVSRWSQPAAANDSLYQKVDELVRDCRNYSGESAKVILKGLSTHSFLEVGCAIAGHDIQHVINAAKILSTLNRVRVNLEQHV